MRTCARTSPEAQTTRGDLRITDRFPDPADLDAVLVDRVAAHLRADMAARIAALTRFSVESFGSVERDGVTEV